MAIGRMYNHVTIIVTTQRNSGIIGFRMALRNLITCISGLTHKTDVANKRYLDDKNPVIALWATAKKYFTSWLYGMIGVNAIGDKQAGCVIPVSGIFIW